jgi:heme exporter protein C
MVTKDLNAMSAQGIKWFWFASPQTFFPLAGTLARWCAGAAALLTLLGLYIGLFVAPTDAQQGEAYRIIFIHVPAAWMSMLIYVVMAFWAALGLAFNTRLSGMMARALAPTGALFTFIALWTGSLWGKPTWGTYWVWDARLTSVLILFFLYLGLMALRSSIEDESLASKLTAILALVGIVMLPIIKFSVNFGNTLHQPASVIRVGGPTIDSSLLTPLLVMAIGFTLMFVAMHLKAMRNEILRRRVKALQLAEVERAQSGQLAAAE